MDENRITYFGETDARNKRVKFGIKAKDRTKHVYVIGKTGMGKSTLLENMAAQDIQNGEGICFIDPHGKTADLLLEYVPKERIRDVIYIAPFDVEHPISFNVLESVDRDKRHLVSSGLMSTFKKIWEDAWSARMEYILTNTLLALLEYPGATLLGVNRMLSDKAYRTDVVSHIQDPSVKAFWTKEFANYTERQAAEAVPAIQNKVGQFTANPLIRNMIGQAQSSFDFRKAMDERKIIIINLSKGKIGDENMKLLGGLLVTKIYLAAMSRADVPDRVMKILPNFYLFVDEFQNFANASFADILSEARKYKLNLTIAHQYIEQMDEIVKPAVFGNVGTMMVFRVGATDAEELEKEFSPTFLLEDLVNLGFAQIYLKLMIDGLSSSPFSAMTLSPIAHPDISYVKEIIAASREQFSQPRALVEAGIVKFHEPMVAKKPEVKSAPSTPGAGTVPVSSAAPSAPVPARVPASPVVPTTPAPAKAVAPVPSPAPSPQKPETPKTPPVSQTPPASPQPPKEHKPFQNLSEQIKVQSKVTPPIAAKPVTPTPSQAPVSLSSLAPKQQQPPKIDPKVPTQKNVNDLRSALAAVLAKNPSSPASEPKKSPQPIQSAASPVPPSTLPPRPEQPQNAPLQPTGVPQSGSANPPSVQANPPVAKQQPQQAPQQPPRDVQKEVPEEVLKKVLKID